jgi:hypothetical protein
MVRIVDKKGVHLVLYIAAICQLSGNLYALGDQGVGHGLESVNRTREVAKTRVAQFIAVCSAYILVETLGDAALFRAHDGENGTCESGASHS